MKSDDAGGDDEETFFANFEFVIAGGKIFQGEAAGAVGFRSVDVAGGVFQFYLSSRDRDVVFVKDDGRAGR